MNEQINKYLSHIISFFSWVFFSILLSTIITHFFLSVWTCSCCWYKSGCFTGWQRKPFKDPHTGNWVAVWFIQVLIKAVPSVFNVPSPSIPLWRKSNYLFSKVKTKVWVQSFCFTLKFSPFWSSHSLLQALVDARPQHPNAGGENVRVLILLAEQCYDSLKCVKL